MSKYTVMFDYSIPQFTDIEIEGADETEDEIKTLAWEIFKDTYPEAMDAEIVEVKLNA